VGAETSSAPDPETAVEPVVVLGGFLTSPGFYRGMCAAIHRMRSCPVEVADVWIWQWAAAVSARGWSRILDRLHESVVPVASSSPTGKVVLVGHSAGGVIGRLYLSDQPFRGRTYGGLERVSTLITLGSPHHNCERARLRRDVERRLPGAFFAPRVRYVVVAGRAVSGEPGGRSSERRAGWFYRHLIGYGEVWGDGLVPVESALLKGAEEVVLDGVYHAPVFGKPWYGSPEVVERWCC
jgi:pimeloyl-ACP methyl ester carboxylesterase